MGFASSGACFPTQTEALVDWCAHVEPGSNAASCASCDSALSTCNVTFLQPSSGTTATVAIPVSTPACTVPTPVDDALAYSGAIVALWVAVWSAKELYNFFRVPHADGN